MADLRNNILVKKVYGPASPTGTGTVTGTVIDRQGFDSVTFVIGNGTQTTTGLTVTPIVKSGSATSSLASCADGVLIGTEAGAAALLASGTGANKIATIGYVGADRYVQCNLTIAAASTGTHVCYAVLGHTRKGPQTQT